MGVFAEACVEKYGFTREAQDAYAFQSQHRAEDAIARGFFEREIVPYTLPDGTVSFSPEFESCKQVATEKNVPIKDVYEAAIRAFAPT